MSRFVTLALSAVSVLALTAFTAPVADSDPAAGVQQGQRTGNWCC